MDLPDVFFCDCLYVRFVCFQYEQGLLYVQHVEEPPGIWKWEM